MTHPLTGTITLTNMTRILLINSDLAKNRGDRAIAEGNIELIRECFPESEVIGLSEYAKRDEAWFNIRFLEMDAQSLSIRDFLRLWTAAKRADLVLWGGGEILKDYTNKLALWYWVCKILALSIANPNIYGAHQGIGPTRSGLSKWLITAVVNRCRLFITRDAESYERLKTWGVSPTKLVSSYDPALLPVAKELTSATKAKLNASFQIDEDVLANFICFAPRSWFHYKQSGFLPFKYRNFLKKKLGLASLKSNDKYLLYLSRNLDMADTMIAQHDVNVVLLPMHMTESDTELVEYIKRNSNYPEKLRLLNSDILSPAELRSVITSARAMIGFRLHSTIISTSSKVPSINIHYVDKGRVFFDQINQSSFTLPIEATLEPDFPRQFSTLLAQLMAQRPDIQSVLKGRMDELRHELAEHFAQSVLTH